MQRDCKPRCYYLGIETRREKTGLRPRFSRQAPSRSRAQVSRAVILQRKIRETARSP